MKPTQEELKGLLSMHIIRLEHAMQRMHSGDRKAKAARLIDELKAVRGQWVIQIEDVRLMDASVTTFLRKVQAKKNPKFYGGK